MSTEHTVPVCFTRGDCNHMDFILTVSLKPGEHVVMLAVGWRVKRQQEQKEGTSLELLQ